MKRENATLTDAVIGHTSVGIMLFFATLLTANAHGADEVTIAEIRDHVAFLASEELEGRLAGHPGAELAATYIINQFREYRLDKMGAHWEMPFYVRGAAANAAGRLTIADKAVEEPGLIQIPNYSGLGMVRATMAAMDTAEVRNKIVVADAEADERAQAADILGRGAAGVVLIRDHDALEPTPPMPRIIMIGEETIEESLAWLPEKSGKELLDTVRLGSPVIAASRTLRDSLLHAITQELQCSIHIEAKGHDESTNVIGVCVGADPVLRNEYVVIGAHYDHIGTANGEINYGADDNASGVAALLEIAEAVTTSERRPDRSIMFVAFGAEESGLVGSKAFCNNPPLDLNSIVAMINLDMIGRNDPEALAVVAASDDLRQIALAAAAQNGFCTTHGDALSIHSTDSGPFVDRNIPTLDLHSGLHADYNTPDDTAERLDCDKVARVARTVLAVALRVADFESRPTFSPPNGGTDK